MADTAHDILFAYPAFTGLVVALIVLALIMRGLKWLDDRRAEIKPAIEGLHSAPDNVERRARRAF